MDNHTLIKDLQASTEQLPVGKAKRERKAKSKESPFDIVKEKAETYAKTVGGRVVSFNVASKYWMAKNACFNWWEGSDTLMRADFGWISEWEDIRDSIYYAIIYSKETGKAYFWSDEKIIRAVFPSVYSRVVAKPVKAEEEDSKAEDFRLHLELAAERDHYLSVLTGLAATNLRLMRELEEIKNAHTLL
jgi:hypothetical protein